MSRAGIRNLVGMSALAMLAVAAPAESADGFKASGHVQAGGDYVFNWGVDEDDQPQSSGDRTYIDDVRAGGEARLKLGRTLGEHVTLGLDQRLEGYVYRRLEDLDGIRTISLVTLSGTFDEAKTVELVPFYRFTYRSFDTKNPYSEHWAGSDAYLDLGAGFRLGTGGQHEWRKRGEDDKGRNLDQTAVEGRVGIDYDAGIVQVSLLGRFRSVDVHVNSDYDRYIAELRTNWSITPDDDLSLMLRYSAFDYDFTTGGKQVKDQVDVIGELAHALGSGFDIVLQWQYRYSSFVSPTDVPNEKGRVGTAIRLNF